MPSDLVPVYRTTLGFEIRTVGANPSAARYAGMSPRRLIVLTMSLCGLFAGLAGTIEILGLGYYPAVFGTSIGFDGDHRRPARAGEPVRHPAGRAAARRRCGPGRRLMQITAGIPIEIIDVIQGVILLFLAAESSSAACLRLRARAGHAERAQTVTRSYGGETAR